MNIKTFLITVLVTILLSPSPIFAQQIILGDNQPYGVPAFRNPNASVGNLVTTGIQIMAIFAAIAVLVFTVWGAFDWITAGGDKEKIAGARRKIANALIGLTLLALASFIVALFGDIVGINPFNMGQIPQIGQQIQPRTTP